MIFGGISAPLLICYALTIPNLEGSPQGDPARMLLFSLAIHPLIRKLSSCGLLFNRWYTDDGTLIDTVPAVTKALTTLAEEGLRLTFTSTQRRLASIGPLSPRSN